jgi:hypothetical protein
MTLCSEDEPVNADKMTNTPSGHIGPFFVPNGLFPTTFGTSLGTPCQDFEGFTAISQKQFTRCGRSYHGWFLL